MNDENQKDWPAIFLKWEDKDIRCWKRDTIGCALVSILYSAMAIILPAHEISLACAGVALGAAMQCWMEYRTRELGRGDK